MLSPTVGSSAEVRRRRRSLNPSFVPIATLTGLAKKKKKKAGSAKTFTSKTHSVLL